MAERMINVGFQDIIHIDHPCKGLSIDAGLVFNVDQSLKQCAELGFALIVYRCGGEKWMAECGGKYYGFGNSPIQAIANMAEEVE